MGAGAAGLYAAYLLARQGIDVVVLEASDRIGGRIRTIREGDLVFDAGGEWLDADHTIALGLCRELGLPLRTSHGNRWVRWRGEQCTTDDLWTDAREAMTRFDESARALLDGNPTPDQTLADLVAQAATTERGAWWLTANYRSDEGDDLDQIGLTGWLSVFRQYADREGNELSAYSLEHGMGSLLDALAGPVGDRIRFGCRVRSVTQGVGVSLGLASGERINADAVIAAVPPWSLDSIAWEPAPSPAQRAAWRRCGRARAIKIAFIFDRAWWQERDWTGSQFCDAPIQQTWDGTRGQAPVLLAYVCGAEAESLMRSYRAFPGSESEFVRGLLPQLGFAEAADAFVSGRVFDWIADAGGAFSFMPPGFYESSLPHLAASLGNVHFAGEHASPWMGFIEGAFESAARAVSRVT